MLEREIHTINLLENDNSTLTQDNRCRLNNIIKCYEKETKQTFLFDLNKFDSNAPNYTQIINDQCSAYVGLIAFFKNIPEFCQINIHDQIKLIKSNLRIFSPLNFMLLTNFAENSQAHNILSRLHSIDFYHQMKNVKRKLDIFAQDPTVLKLLLIILVHTISLLTLNSTVEAISVETVQHAHKTQMFYIELLWNYMQHAYGKFQAILIYSLLIFQCLNLQSMIAMRDEHMRRLVNISHVTPLMQSILQLSFENDI
ncbi:unnamed protein product [Didymodactylos carnosus]|uniref:NR LBD domain-containing protein n=1 Tax=Didymodactylos carnosus TaxID=1234261 RepID=A0A815G978_9BILA|nr:unnamed protein product [Didymodactylos carnosus]CAF1529142.1 unnamed protein product [Didymodactylos carnosus]CAF4192373.1 unnamed protein product [Didymodactylos carnosus]CAF4315851.1 unnamed protein product [Didymodactylos carnosus]